MTTKIMIVHAGGNRRIKVDVAEPVAGGQAGSEPMFSHSISMLTTEGDKADVHLSDNTTVTLSEDGEAQQPAT